MRLFPSWRSLFFALASAGVISRAAAVESGPENEGAPAVPQASVAGGWKLAPAEQAAFQKKFQPFLEEHCFDCHDGSTQKGGIRLDNLEPQFGQTDAATRW